VFVRVNGLKILQPAAALALVSSGFLELEFENSPYSSRENMGALLILAQGAGQSAPPLLAHIYVQLSKFATYGEMDAAPRFCSRF
jgi:hypothetical protein